MGEFLQNTSFLQRLSFLDLSYNKLTEVDTGVFAALPILSSLSLGHNSNLTLGRNGATFKGIEDTLQFLDLDNISLVAVCVFVQSKKACLCYSLALQVPDLSLPNVISLSMAYNSLPTISVEMAASLNSLRNLNLAYNNLTAVPVALESMSELRSLSLAGNPITVLSNATLLEISDNLEELDLTNIDLNSFEVKYNSKMKTIACILPKG